MAVFYYYISVLVILATLYCENCDAQDEHYIEPDGYNAADPLSYGQYNEPIEVRASLVEPKNSSNQTAKGAYFKKREAQQCLCEKSLRYLRIQQERELAQRDEKLLKPILEALKTIGQTKIINKIVKHKYTRDEDRNDDYDDEEDSKPEHRFLGFDEPRHVQICLKDNEEFKKCGTACQPTCMQPELRICSKNCVIGCFCKSGFVRDAEGNCITREQCLRQREPVPKCLKDNEEFQTCGSACQPTCMKPEPRICSKNCAIGCFCKPGYVRDTEGDCITREQCLRQRAEQYYPHRFNSYQYNPYYLPPNGYQWY